MSLNSFGVLCRHCLVAGVAVLSLITLAVLVWAFVL